MDDGRGLTKFVDEDWNAESITDLVRVSVLFLFQWLRNILYGCNDSIFSNYWFVQRITDSKSNFTSPDPDVCIQICSQINMQLDGYVVVISCSGSNSFFI